MMFQILVTVLLFVAFFLQLAVDRAPDLKESRDNKAARRVLIAGLFVTGAFMAHACFRGVSPHVWPLIGILFMALAEIAFCINRLFPTVFVTLPHSHRRDEKVAQK